MSSYGGPSIVRDSLVIHLDADDVSSYPESGNIWYDLSGKNNHCVFSNTPTFDSSGRFFTFNGTSNQGTITNNSTLDFSNEQTITMVLYHTYVSGRKNPWNQAYAGYGTWTHEDGGLINQYFGDGGGDNSPYIGIESPSTPRGVWNIMTTVRNLTYHKWFFNQVPSSYSINPYATLTSTAANITIGNGYAGFWEGNMAIVLAYNRGLQDYEVIQNFNTLKNRFNLL